MLGINSHVLLNRSRVCFHPPGHTLPAPPPPLHTTPPESPQGSRVHLASLTCLTCLCHIRVRTRVPYVCSPPNSTPPHYRRTSHPSHHDELDDDDAAAADDDAGADAADADAGEEEEETDSDDGRIVPPSVA